MKKILDFYVDSSLHVALSSLSLVLVTRDVFNISLDIFYSLFVFCSTVVSYNFIKNFKLDKKYYGLILSFSNPETYLNILSLIIIIYCYLNLLLIQQILIIPFVLITILYALPFSLINKTSAFRGLRLVPYLKVYLVAIVWCGVTLIIPLIKYGDTDLLNVLCFGLERFIFIVLLMLPFEIRDLKDDELRLFTIPQIIGVVNTKRLGVALFLVLCVLNLLFLKLENNVSLTIYLLTLLLLLKANEKRSKYYTSFWLEAIPILWLIMI